jgi:3',5'-cyclic AMP phosphodiesterase CpdA
MTKFASETPEIRFLFRYRDLVASTIDEHRAIINDSNGNGCWWGWWKRQNEDSRLDVWKDLAAIIADSQHVDIGLFDSGAEQDDQAVRRARVVEVVAPTELDTFQASDKRLVPSYYRRSPFSRAWMRIESFDELPLHFFQQYSYESAPPLPGIPEQHLKNLDGKRVVSHDELRAMDTTIWRVRPSKPEDSSTQFLAPGLRLLEAVSTQSVAVQGDKILHLTDLHFAAEPSRRQHAWGYPGEEVETLAEAIGAATTGTGVAAVVVTGDFIFNPEHAEEEFRLAGKSLNALLGTLGLDPSALILIPGNHDIRWAKPKGDKYEEDAPIRFAAKTAQEHYRKFYQDLMGHDPHDYLAMGRRMIFPSGVVVDICALNSSSLEQGSDFLAGMGRVRPDAFQRVREVLGWEKDKASMSLRVLALHHHLTLTENVESPSEYSKGFGILIDAKQILREAAEAGVHLVLHGHRHRAFVGREHVYHLPVFSQTDHAPGEVSIFGGGSAGSTDVYPFNTFNLMKVGSGGLDIEIFTSEKNSPFKPVQAWRADFSLKEGNLHLAPWVPK